MSRRARTSEVVDVPAARWTARDGSCGVVHATEALAGKWTLAIVRSLLGGPLRFTELQQSIGRVAAKPLTEALRGMEERGLVVRTYFPEVPPRVEYALSPRGESLLTVVAAMADWGSRDLDATAGGEASGGRPPAAPGAVRSPRRAERAHGSTS